jgi:hypothetical protein
VLCCAVLCKHLQTISTVFMTINHNRLLSKLHLTRIRDRRFRSRRCTQRRCINTHSVIYHSLPSQSQNSEHMPLPRIQPLRKILITFADPQGQPNVQIPSDVHVHALLVLSYPVPRGAASGISSTRLDLQETADQCQEAIISTTGHTNSKQCIPIFEPQR